MYYISMNINDTMSQVELNKAIIQRYFEAYNNKNEAIFDEITPSPHGTIFSIYRAVKHSADNAEGKKFLKTRKRGYLWVTFLYFVMSLAIHWTFAWFSYAEEQIEHNQPIELSGYFNQQ
jgi:hypothetical protein